MTQLNLGNAYGKLMTGDRGGNLQKAIECHQLALEVATRESFPQEWAETLYSLGVALQEITKYHDCEGLAKAWRCFATLDGVPELQCSSVNQSSITERLDHMRKTAAEWGCVL
jgi:hypothetical protein